MGINKSSGISDQLVITSILYAIWTYIAVKTPFHYYNDLLGIILLGSVVLLTIVLFVINIVTILSERTLLPFAIFVACALILWFMPGTTPDEAYFSRYRKDYEKVVVMARQHKIEHNEECQQNRYSLPRGYEHLITDKCISVNYEPILEVIFLNKTPGKFLFYAESLHPDILCGGDLGLIEKKIDDQWYICKEYWN